MDSDIKIQVNEVLTKTQIKAKHRSRVEEWLSNFTDWVASVKQINGLPIEDFNFLMKKLKIKNVPLPARVHPHKTSNYGLFRWTPPTEIALVGSWDCNVALHKLSAFDLVIEIPKECLNKSDYLNHKYHVKRALYLSYLGARLNERGDTVHVSWPDGNLLLPVLEITIGASSDKQNAGTGHVKIRLHFTPPENFFELRRFHPDTNNVRFKQFFNCSSEQEDDIVFSTPNYNQTILLDLLMLQNHKFIKSVLPSACGIINSNNICEAIKLLKIWLEKRYLNQGYGSFSNYILTMFVCYLFLQKKINNSMSSYHVVRIVFVNLINSEWDSKGICLDDTATQQYLKDWFLQFDCVFLDNSRSLNYTSFLSKYKYKRVKEEAQIGLDILNSSNVSGFRALFVKDIPFCLNFDHMLKIRLTPDFMKKFELQSEQKQSILNTSGYIYPIALTLIGDLIESCLKKRIQFIDVETARLPLMSIAEGDIPRELQGYADICFGLTLERSTTLRLLEKCESENEDEIESFKKLWGSKSQLRRFLDGTIVESVSFEAEKFNVDNHVCFIMLQYILKKHMDIHIGEDEIEAQDGKSPVAIGYYLDKQIERFIEPRLEKLTAAQDHNKVEEKRSNEPPRNKIKRKHKVIERKLMATLTVDQITQLATTSFDSLGKMLRSLEELPLSISSVQCTSSVVRNTHIWPTLPQSLFLSDVLTTRTDDIQNCVLVRENIQKVPKFVEAIGIIVQLEGSGKWPDNIHAIQRLKCALLIRIGNLLQKKYGLTVQAFPLSLYVIKDGFIFNIQLTHLRELILLKQLKGEDGVLRFRDNVESVYREKMALLLPKLSSNLTALNNKYSSFGQTCRLVKRWIASHLLLGSNQESLADPNHSSYCITEEAVELLVASVFLNYYPYIKPPNEPQIGFVRFLVFLTTTDWHSFAVIVNFNDNMSKEEIHSIETEFTKRRATLPTPFISYPDDKLNSLWTRNVLPALWKRLIKLGEYAMNLLLTHYKSSVLTSMSQTSAKYIDPFKSIFKPDISQFDFIIRIKKSMNSKKDWSLSAVVSNNETPKTRGFKRQFNEYTKIRNEAIPVVGFDPMQLFVQELRENFGHLGLFLYDVFGGEFIAFIWKPDALKESEFKISTIKGQMLESMSPYSRSTVVTPNTDGLIELINILGRGIVDTIDITRNC